MIDYTTRTISESVTVVQVGGKLDEAGRKYIFSRIGDMIESGTRYIIIECQQIGHVNSGALASLLSARKLAAKKGGRIYLTHLNSIITEAMELTKLRRLLAVYPTTEAALEAVRSDPACVG